MANVSRAPCTAAGCSLALWPPLVATIPRMRNLLPRELKFSKAFRLNLGDVRSLSGELWEEGRVLALSLLPLYFPRYISADLFFFFSTNFLGAIVKELVSDRAGIIAIMSFFVVGMDCTVLLDDVDVYHRWHPSNSCISCNSCNSRKRGIERMRGRLQFFILISTQHFSRSSSSSLAQILEAEAAGAVRRPRMLAAFLKQVRNLG